MNGPAAFGIAGGLTRAFIASPLTPLFLIAAFAFGLVALLTLPREEEPQISVPMVDIFVRADGLKADDAVKLVTEPLETIVKGIDGVEHVYSQSRDDQVMVTARFVVGTSSDAAVLRVHDKVRANMDRIPVGVPEPLIVGRGIDDVAIVTLTLSPNPEAAARMTANDLTRIARELRTEIAKIDNVGLTYLVGDTGEIIRVAPEPGKARPLRRDLAAARGQGLGRQQGLSGRTRAQSRRADRYRRRRDAGLAGPDRQSAADLARQSPRLCPRCRRRRLRDRHRRRAGFDAHEVRRPA